jgi:hypothetical protein
MTSLESALSKLDWCTRQQHFSVDLSGEESGALLNRISELEAMVPVVVEVGE